MVPRDRIRHGMSNEHEEWDPLSARTSFFSRNHAFHVNVFCLCIFADFSFQPREYHRIMIPRIL